MKHEPYTIMCRRYYYGSKTATWLPIISDGTCSPSPVVCTSPVSAVAHCNALNETVYYLWHNESGRPDYGYIQPSGKVRMI